MQEIRGRMFAPYTYRHPSGEYASLKPDVVCITTNGFVKKDGTAVMGRGCARELSKYYSHASKSLGKHLLQYGNIPYIFPMINVQYKFVSFPVKPAFVKCASDKSNVVQHMKAKFHPGQKVPGWAAKADLNLIVQSAQRLTVMANENEWQTIIIPRPGSGAGELYWRDVKTVLGSVLDDRFYSITFK